MNLRVAHNGEDREMDVVADGPTVSHDSAPWWNCCGVRYPHQHEDVRESINQAGAVAITASLQRAIQRDPNPRGTWKGALLSEDGTQLLIDTADGRTFILTVREV